MDTTIRRNTENKSGEASGMYKYLEQHTGDPLTFKYASTQEITSIIKSLNTKNSTGYDEISTKILKISDDYISSPLTHIVNKSISVGIFPERLKYSIINPVYKKGDKTDPVNYRPVSLLTAFSKVLEKVLYNRLIAF